MLCLHLHGGLLLLPLLPRTSAAHILIRATTARTFFSSSSSSFSASISDYSRGSQQPALMLSHSSSSSLSHANSAIFICYNTTTSISPPRTRLCVFNCCFHATSAAAAATSFIPPLAPLIPPHLPTFHTTTTAAAATSTSTSTSQSAPSFSLPNGDSNDEALVLDGEYGGEDKGAQAHDVTSLPMEKLFLPPGMDGQTSLSLLSEAISRVLKGSNVMLSKEYISSSMSGSSRAHVSEAEFIKSSTKLEQCPSDGLPEFAFVGRSNVGKSSLLNSLVRRKQLALTSKKPGKTQCINHFLINKSWYLVDLPGYGYASAPQQLRVDWNQFTRNYLLQHSSIVSVFLLIDASIPAKKIDLDYARWLGEHQIPMTIVFTKCDKRKKRRNGGKRPEENVEDFQAMVSEHFQKTPPWIMTSSVSNQGRDELLLHAAQLRNYWLKN